MDEESDSWRTRVGNEEDPGAGVGTDPGLAQERVPGPDPGVRDRDQDPGAEGGQLLGMTRDPDRSLDPGVQKQREPIETRVDPEADPQSPKRLTDLVQDPKTDPDQETGHERSLERGVDHEVMIESLTDQSPETDLAPGLVLQTDDQRLDHQEIEMEVRDPDQDP